MGTPTVIDQALFAGTPNQKRRAQRYRMLKEQVGRTEVHEEQVALVSEMVTLSRELTEEINPRFLRG